MKITQDVRDYAAQQAIDHPDEALAIGMAEKSREFAAGGMEIYQTE